MGAASLLDWTEWRLQRAEPDFLKKEDKPQKKKTKALGGKAAPSADSPHSGLVSPPVRGLHVPPSLPFWILHPWFSHSNSSPHFPSLQRVRVPRRGPRQALAGAGGVGWVSRITHHSRGSYKPRELLHSLSRFPLDRICSCTAPVCEKVPVTSPPPPSRAQ